MLSWNNEPSLSFRWGLEDMTVEIETLDEIMFHLVAWIAILSNFSMHFMLSAQNFPFALS